MNFATSDFLDLPDDNDKFLDPTPAPTVAPVDNSPVIYEAVCPKCHGSGRYNAPSSLGHQVCLQCKGKGKLQYKRSEAERQASRDRRHARKERVAQATREERITQVEAWKAEHPAETLWMRDRAPHFEFAAKMVEAVKQWGHLTEGQLAAVRRLMAQDADRDAARAANRAATEARAFEVDIAQIEQAFAKATNTTSGMALQKPKLRLGRYIFSLAPASGRNAGSIYVKRCADGETEQEYLGKIFQGKLFPTRDCTPEDQATITEVASKPKEAAEKYGRLTGRCAICNRSLLRDNSVERGIGPICAERFGFL